jgi:hypothetical protein
MSSLPAGVAASAAAKRGIYRLLDRHIGRKTEIYENVTIISCNLILASVRTTDGT